MAPTFVTKTKGAYMLYDDIIQRWPSTEELAGILGAIKLNDTVLFEKASELFSEVVDPEVAHEEDPSKEDCDRCNMAFSEWVLFDYDLGLGYSVLERMAHMDASLVDFVTTQFFSRFWVISQDPEHDMSVLRDLRTHEDFEVHSHHIANQPRWATGTLGTRLACVNDEWRSAGRLSLHDNAASEPGPASAYPMGRGIHDRYAFIENVRLLYGHEGDLRDTILSVETYV